MIRPEGKSSFDGYMEEEAPRQNKTKENRLTRERPMP